MCIRSLSFQWLPSVCGVIPLAPGLTEPEGASSKESVLVISTRILVENLRELPWAIPEGLVSPACFSIAGSASSVQENGLDFRKSLKKGSALSASREMKRLRAARDPVSF